MKKRLKILLLIMFAYIFTGCSINYNLVVTSNYKVEETVEIVQFGKYMKILGLDKENVKVTTEENYNNYFENNDYKYKTEIVDDDVKTVINKSLNKINLINKNIEFQKIFNYATIDKTKKGLTFKTTGIYNKYYLFPKDDSNIGEPLDNININIQFHNVVVDCNADKYDKKTNTYTWIIDKDTENKNIEFTVINKKRYDIIKEYLLKKYKYKFLVISIIILLAIVGIIYITIKNKKIKKI